MSVWAERIQAYDGHLERSAMERYLDSNSACADETSRGDVSRHGPPKHTDLKCIGKCVDDRQYAHWCSRHSINQLLSTSSQTICTPTIFSRTAKVARKSQFYSENSFV